jgi:hypothetical protein
MLAARAQEPGMSQRLRLGGAGGNKPVGVVVAAVLLVALVVTGRSLSGRWTRPSTPMPTPAAPVADAPLRVGERTFCTARRPVLATSDGRSYPPGHPARPPRDADPVACYQTAGQATAAGYAPAPLPPGALHLDGTYLVPTSGRLRRQCRQAAEHLGFAVPCPTVLPASSSGAPPPRLCQHPLPCGNPQTEFLLESTGFEVPSGHVGAYAAPAARLVVAAAKRPTASAVACVGERPLGPVGVRGTRAGLFQCPQDSGPHRGGVLLRWRERGTVMALSVTGRSDLHRRVVLALAAHLEVVPGGR